MFSLSNQTRKRGGATAFLGRAGSSAAIAVPPVAEAHKKILIVEPTIADEISGDTCNRRAFRTGRNSLQDAIPNAAAISKPTLHVAKLAGLSLRP